MIRKYALLFLIVQSVLIAPINGMLSQVSRSAAGRQGFFKGLQSTGYRGLVKNMPINRRLITTPKKQITTIPSIPQKQIITNQRGSYPRLSMAGVLSALGLGWLWSGSEEREDDKDVDELLVTLKANRALGVKKLVDFLQEHKGTTKADRVFEKLLADENALLYLSTAFGRDIEMPETLVPFIKKNYRTLSMSQSGVWLLNSLIAKDATVVAELTKFAQDNFDNLCRNAESDALFATLVKYNAHAAQDFSALAQGKVVSLLNTKAGKELIDNVLVNLNDGVAKERALSLLDSSTEFSPKVFNACLTKLKDDKDIELLMRQTHKDNDLASLLKELIYKKHCVHCIKDDEKSLSISMKTLRDQIESWSSINTMDKYIIHDKGLSRLVMNALQAEDKNKKEGYYTFYHGQPYGLGYHQRWFSWLNDMNDTKPGLLLPVVYNIPNTQKGRDAEEKATDLVINAKNWVGLRTEGREHPLALFTTENLFKNITLPLVVQNISTAPKPTLTIEQTFQDAHEYGAYTQFKKRLEALEKEYLSLSDKGQLLQFAVRKDHLKDIVFPSGDSPRPAIKVDGSMQEIHDPLILLDTLEKSPEKVQLPGSFGIVATSRLKNTEGVKCRAFNAVDPAKWAEYEKKERALRDDIKHYIESQK